MDIVLKQKDADEILKFIREVMKAEEGNHSMLQATCVDVTKKMGLPKAGNGIMQTLDKVHDEMMAKFARFVELLTVGSVE